MRRMLMIGLVAAGLCGAALVGVVLAGTYYKLECLNAKCAYKGECQLGGGFTFDSLDGYCVSCGKWVRVKWDRKGGKAPDPLGKVWVAETGKTMPVYACPTCKGPFLPVTGNEAVKDSKYAEGQKLGGSDRILHCPKCGEPSLWMHAEVFFD